MNIDHEFHPLTVLEVVEETADTKSFVLDVPDELAGVFDYEAGQFCTFQARIGAETVGRCYSMSSSPDLGERLTVTVKRVPGGIMSNWMNDHLAPGDTIEVLRPAGLFVLHDTEVPIVAFAGGSGITPILSIVKSALVNTMRDIVLVDANRDPDNVILGGVIEKLAAQSGGRLTVHQHFDSESGFLDAAACAAFIGDRTDAHVYVCGPGPFMDTVEAGLALAGVDPSQLFIERFALGGDEAVRAPVSVTETLVIRLDRKKTTIDYQSGDTVMDSARRAGLAPPFSCEAGSCATCMAKVEEGEATMRVNNALTPEEVADGWVLTCQTIPLTEKVVVNFDA